MTRYCGECGSSLGAAALHAGRCPACGTHIDALEEAEEAQYPGNIDLADDITQTSARRRVPALWALTLLSMVALLLAGAASYALAQHGTFTVVLAPFTSSNPNASSSGAPAASATSTISTLPETQTETPGSGGTTVPTVPPLTSGSPAPSLTTSPSPSGSPTSAPTSMPAPPALSVSPTSFNNLVCLAGKAQFTISNTGGMPLVWSASASVDGYQITPSNGSIEAGLQEKVTVSSILQSGIVTVTSSNGTNSPQQVSINCTL